MHPVFVLVGFIMTGGFSAIMVTQREETATKATWGTVLLCVVVIPILVFILVGVASWLSLK